jgi:hypothetical protein
MDWRGCAVIQLDMAVMLCCCVALWRVDNCSLLV